MLTKMNKTKDLQHNSQDFRNIPIINKIYNF